MTTGAYAVHADEARPVLPISLVRYLRYDRRKMLGYACLYAYVAGLATFTSYWTLLLWLLVLARQVQDYRAMRELFARGLLCPAVVVDPSGGLVAIYCDLMIAGEKPARVLKVVRERLAAAGRLFRPGEHVIAVCRLLETSKHWYGLCAGDVTGIVIDCLVTDQQAADRAVRGCPPQLWQEADRHVRRIGPQPRPGLYRIDTLPEMMQHLP